MKFCLSVLALASRAVRAAPRLRATTSCTYEGGDVYSTGSRVPCCAGLEQTLTDEPIPRWVCQSGNAGPVPAPVPMPVPVPVPVPVPSPVPADLALCYGYGDPGRGPSLAELVANDMAKVASCPATQGVKKIRTYFPSYFGDKVTGFEGLADKRLLPGFNPADALAFRAPIEKDLREVYAEASVEAIIYLNEVYSDHAVGMAHDFLRSMAGVRTDKPVLTSQTTQTDYSRYTNLLAQGFDGIMINVYPGHTFTWKEGDNPISPEDHFVSFCHQLNEITDYYTSHDGRGEKFYGVSETGLPAHPFGAGAVQAYFNKIKEFVAGGKDCPQFSYDQLVALNGGAESWLGIYGFAATSESNKGSPLENSFGIADAFCPREEGGGLVLASVA